MHTSKRSPRRTDHFEHTYVGVLKDNFLPPRDRGPSSPHNPRNHRPLPSRLLQPSPTVSNPPRTSPSQPPATLRRRLPCAPPARTAPDRPPTALYPPETTPQPPFQTAGNRFRKLDLEPPLQPPSLPPAPSLRDGIRETAIACPTITKHPPLAKRPSAGIPAAECDARWAPPSPRAGTRASRRPSTSSRWPAS